MIINKKSQSGILYTLIAFVVFVSLIVSGCDLLTPRTFPKKTSPKIITLSCDYHGKKVSMTETLYKSVDGYYSSDPDKEGFTYQSKYASFVNFYKEDNTLKSLTGKIINEGKKLGLDSDKTMDLAACLVQDIPYDTKKGEQVLSRTGDLRSTLGRFPYETLFDNKGICTDKSYLLAAIIKELGYGVSILVFDKEKHMAIGVLTPNGYTSFQTKYSYLETTNKGFKVGQLPVIDQSIGGAKNPNINSVGKDSLSENSLLEQIPQSNFTSPSGVYEVAKGKEYQRIIEITKQVNRLKEIIPVINNLIEKLIVMKKELNQQAAELEKQQKEVDSYVADVESAEAIYKADPTGKNYSNYRKIFNTYKSKYNDIKGEVDSYNYNVSLYNAKIKSLNALIDEYNNLIKSE